MEAVVGYDKPREECGVFGIYEPGAQATDLTYLGLQALQHRGQQGAGIASGNGETVVAYRELGLVRDAFGPSGRHLSGLPANADVATGHTRYATSRTPEKFLLRALQPMLYNTDELEDHQVFSLSHNGHVEDLASTAAEYGLSTATYVSDTEIMRDIIGFHYQRNGYDLRAALMDVLPRFEGAYSLVLSTAHELLAARDPQGFRPLHLGKRGDEGWVVASEIAALDAVGAEAVREVAPGEILTIDGRGVQSENFTEPNPALCGFEFVYFSRTDNEMFGETVLEVRERMGELLAHRDNVEADMVIGVPESAIAVADGYSQASGMPHRKALVRNPYVGRSFIASSQGERTRAVQAKLNPVSKLIEGKSIVVVDDSMVRGTTQKELVKMLRRAGADQVHIRISSPPYKHPCFYGMDTGRPNELLAADNSIEQIREYIGADSLDFLTNEDMQEAVGAAAGKICTACTTGVYPTSVPVNIKS